MMPWAIVWINHGNPRSGPALLSIYLNNVLKAELASKGGRRLTLRFQEKLGKLKKGDMVRIAIDPAAKRLIGSGELHQA